MMRGKKRLGASLTALGFTLLLAAGGLLLYNHAQSRQAAAAAGRVLEQLTAQIALRREDGTATAAPIPAAVLPDPSASERAAFSDPTVQIDGVDYIGVLSFPSLSMELPVMAQWSYEGLRTAPGRFSGSAAGGDLVVAGHNYASQLGAMDRLSLDDPVLFTDVNGKVYQYAVLDIEILQPTAVAEMNAGEYPLTVFTCTYGGQTRLTIRCG